MVSWCHITGWLAEQHMELGVDLLQVLVCMGGVPGCPLESMQL